MKEDFLFALLSSALKTIFFMRQGSLKSEGAFCYVILNFSNLSKFPKLSIKKLMANG